MFAVQAPVREGLRFGVQRRQRGAGGQRRGVLAAPARARGRRASSPAACARSRSAPSSTAASWGRLWAGSDSRAHTIEPSGALGDALDRRDRALQRLDHLGHRDLHRASARAGSRRGSRAGSRPAPPCADAPPDAPGRRAEGRRARRSPSAVSDRSPARLASSTITRTPYSALVENIISVIPTCALGYQQRSSELARQLVRRADVVARVRGELFELEHDPLAAIAVEQQHRRRAGPGAFARARGHDVVGAPDRSQLRAGAGQVAQGARSARPVRGSARTWAGRVGGGIDADERAPRRRGRVRPARRVSAGRSARRRCGRSSTGRSGS